MARIGFYLLLLIAGLAAIACAEPVHPTLVNGVITYTADDGSRKRINVGKPCDDLWVAPDESVIAFIGIDKSGEEFGTQFRAATSVYVPRKADNFAPTRIVTRVRIMDHDWSVFHHPSVAPDGSKVIFMVSVDNTTVLVSYELETRKNTEIAWQVVDYCTIQSGVEAGSVLMLRRLLGEDADGVGYGYICYRNAPGRPAPGQRLGACSEFAPTLPTFNKYGAACTQTPR